MLKATKVQAVALALTDGKQAVLVQEGAEWNLLRKFKCIAPAEFEGQGIIATRDQHGSPMATAFGALFDLGVNERWVVVMCSPNLSARLHRDPDGVK